jgi:hypothetical protein
VCKHCPDFADPPPDNHLDVRISPNADSPNRPLLVYQVIEMVCKFSARENGRGIARGRIDLDIFLRPITPILQQLLVFDAISFHSP